MTTNGSNGAHGRPASLATRARGSAQNELARLDNVPQSPPLAADKSTIVILEGRLLIRDCMVKCLNASDKHIVLAFDTIAEWQKARSLHPTPSLVLLCTEGRTYTDLKMERDLATLSRSVNAIPIVVVSDVEDLDHVVAALDSGARGYIPTSVSLDIALEAIHLVEVGGTFVPANILMSSKRTGELTADPKGLHNGLFTARQAAVVAAIKQGKANKLIAYELNMRESTVKVHVRNIMKKLNAKNRTEVAVLTSHFIPIHKG